MDDQIAVLMEHIDMNETLGIDKEKEMYDKILLNLTEEVQNEIKAFLIDLAVSMLTAISGI